MNPDGAAAVKGRRLAPRAAAEGYAYIFPKRDHVNVGVGYVLEHYREAIDASPYELQRAFVDHLRRPRRSRGRIGARATSRRSSFPSAGRSRDPGRGRVLLAGDAGGFVNGVHGRRHLLRDGLGRAGRPRDCRDARRGPSPLLAGRYRRACDHEIGAELRDSVLIQRYLFADRRRIAQRDRRRCVVNRE